MLYDIIKGDVKLDLLGYHDATKAAMASSIAESFKSNQNIFKDPSAWLQVTFQECGFTLTWA